MSAELPTNAVRYGRINTELIRRWLELAPEDDGPFWALNLMKYRDVADYADGRAETRSGREADDAYTPRESLAAIGAQIVFGAEVEQVLAGDGTAWDRVGIVRYPSRRAFLAMQQREDFKEKHVHKDAGMEFTIVMSCQPVLPFTGRDGNGDVVELRVSSEDAAAGGAPGGVFDVEGVIVGDERTWTRASFRWLDAGEPTAEIARQENGYTMLLRPVIDRLAASVTQ